MAALFLVTLDFGLFFGMSMMRFYRDCAEGLYAGAIG